jgi:hypothetical protein
LVPASEIPWAKYRWRAMKMTAGGRVAIRALAMLMQTGIPTSTPSISAAGSAGSVRVESLLVTMNGQTKLFHLAMNVKVETVVNAGLDKGRMMQGKE